MVLYWRSVMDLKKWQVWSLTLHFAFSTFSVQDATDLAQRKRSKEDPKELKRQSFFGPKQDFETWYAFWRKKPLHCTEGWDCDLGIWGSKIFFANNGLGGFLEPHWKVFHHGTLRKHFQGPLQLSEVGLVVKKGQNQVKNQFCIFALKMCNKCSELVKNWQAWKN